MTTNNDGASCASTTDCTEVPGTNTNKAQAQAPQQDEALRRQALNDGLAPFKDPDFGMPQQDKRSDLGAAITAALEVLRAIALNRRKYGPYATKAQSVAAWLYTVSRDPRPATHPQQDEGSGAAFFSKVAETVKEAELGGDGFWRTCTGCHESEDGHDVGHYPHNPAFNVKLGGGCSECGGVGATWDTTDYNEMAAEMVAEMNATPPLRGEDREKVAREIEGIIAPYGPEGDVSGLINGISYSLMCRILAALALPDHAQAGGACEARLREALEPFAALARVRYPEEGGAPSWIDLLTANGEHDELELRSHAAASPHSEILYADAFRNALAALSASPAILNEGE